MRGARGIEEVRKPRLKGEGFGMHGKEVLTRWDLKTYCGSRNGVGERTRVPLFGV